MLIEKFMSDYRLSQRELADVLDCSSTHISNIIKGKRALTGLHLRLLIERFGFNVISEYSEPGDPMPKKVEGANITGNSAPVQNGDGNVCTDNSALIAIIRQQTELMRSKDEQISRLLAIIENLQKS